MSLELRRELWKSEEFLRGQLPKSQKRSTSNVAKRGT